MSFSSLENSSAAKKDSLALVFPRKKGPAPIFQVSLITLVPSFIGPVATLYDTQDSIAAHVNYVLGGFKKRPKFTEAKVRGFFYISLLLSVLLASRLSRRVVQ